MQNDVWLGSWHSWADGCVVQCVFIDDLCKMMFGWVHGIAGQMVVLYNVVNETADSCKLPFLCWCCAFKLACDT
jgi:hypothetical protein